MTGQHISVTKKRGRPKKEPSATIRLPIALFDEVDAWRATQPDQPGRPEAIRRLIRAALPTPDQQ